MSKPTRPQPPPVSVRQPTPRPLIQQKRTPPAAPPVYRPQPTPKVLQRKGAAPRPSPAVTPKSQPAAPPVYRPQPPPKALQAKTLAVRRPARAESPRPRAVPPPVYRPEVKTAAPPKTATPASPHRRLPAAPAPWAVQRKSARTGQAAGPLRPVVPPSPRAIQVIQRMEDDLHERNEKILAQSETMFLSEVLEMDYGEIPGMDRFRQSVRDMPTGDQGFYTKMKGYDFQLKQTERLHKQEKVSAVEHRFDGTLTQNRYADILTTDDEYIDCKAYAKNYDPSAQEKRRFFEQAHDYAHSGKTVKYIFSNNPPEWVQKILYAVNQWFQPRLRIGDAMPVFPGSPPDKNEDALVKLMKQWCQHNPGPLH